MAGKPRASEVNRKTTETDVALELCLDGEGTASVDTGIPFFDHMLELFARHGLFDLTVRARGDTDVDLHHTVEDVGLCLGEALKKALGDKSGIRRYGRGDVPMMDALPTVAVDLGGRPNIKFNTPGELSPLEGDEEALLARAITKEFDMGLAREFMTAFANEAGMDLHVTLHYGEDLHHSIEAVFKALGRALREAVETDPRLKGVMSTKGRL